MVAIFPYLSGNYLILIIWIFKVNYLLLKLVCLTEMKKVRVTACFDNDNTVVDLEFSGT